MTTDYKYLISLCANFRDQVMCPFVIDIQRFNLSIIYDPSSAAYMGSNFNYSEHNVSKNWEDWTGLQGWKINDCYEYPTIFEEFEGINSTINLMPPAIDDDNMKYYFTSFKNGKTHIHSKWIANNSKINESEIYFTSNNVDTIISFQPTYYKNNIYLHLDDMLVKINAFDLTDQTLMYRDDNISVDSVYWSHKYDVSVANINSVIVISSHNKLLFVNGKYLCAFDISDNDHDKTNAIWCNHMIGGTSQQFVSPAVNNALNMVYIYDNHYIWEYSQLNGTTYGSYTQQVGQNLMSISCDYVFSCMSNQPIVTNNNIIFQDGTYIYVFSTTTKQVVAGAMIYWSQILPGVTSMSWYNDTIYLATAATLQRYIFYDPY